MKSTKFIVALPLQQWVREHVMKLYVQCLSCTIHLRLEGGFWMFLHLHNEIYVSFSTVCFATTVVRILHVSECRTRIHGRNAGALQLTEVRAHSLGDHHAPWPTLSRTKVQCYWYVKQTNGDEFMTYIGEFKCHSVGKDAASCRNTLLILRSSHLQQCQRAIKKEETDKNSV